MSRTSSIASAARGRVAALSRSRTADDPVLINARRELAVANVEVAIEKHLAGVTLTDEQLSRLSVLLIGAAR